MEKKNNEVTSSMSIRYKFYFYRHPVVYARDDTIIFFLRITQQSLNL